MGRVRRKRTEEEKAERRKKNLNEWRPILTVVGGSAYFIRVGRLIDPSKPAAPGNYEYVHNGMTFDTDERAERVAESLNEAERRKKKK